MPLPSGQFSAFWAYVRQNLSEPKFSKMLKALHRSLLEELDNPRVGLWSPQYLAFRTVCGAITSVGGWDTTTVEYPAVVNDWQLSKQLINLRALKYLAKPAYKGEELLLDILQGGRGSVNRHTLANALNLPIAMHSPESDAPVAANRFGADASVTTDTADSPEASAITDTRNSPEASATTYTRNSPETSKLVATNPSEVDAARTTNHLGTEVPVAANPPGPDLWIATASPEAGALATTISSGCNASKGTAFARAEQSPHEPLSPPPSQSPHAIRSSCRPRGSRNRGTRVRAVRGPYRYIDEIYIPTLINIDRHLEPHFRQLQDTHMIWLKVNKDRRLVAFGPQNEGCWQPDHMALDRHRQEFRWMILSYV